MVQILPANPRKSFIENLSSGLMPAIESGVKLYQEHQRKKDYAQALQGLSDVYSNPKLSESQKLIGAYQRLSQFPEAAQQLAGPLSRLGAQEQKFSSKIMDDQRKQEQLNQSFQDIQGIYSNPDLSEEEKTFGVYQKLNQNPTLAHNLLQSLQKPAKARNEDLAGQQFTKGYSALQEGDESTFRDVLSDPETPSIVRNKLVALQNQLEVRKDVKSREVRARQSLVQRSYKQAIDREQKMYETASLKERPSIKKNIKKLEALQRADLKRLAKNPDIYPSLSIWNAVDPDFLPEEMEEEEGEFEPIEAEKKKVKFNPKNPQHVAKARQAMQQAGGNRAKANEILAEEFIYE